MGTLDTHQSTVRSCTDSGEDPMRITFDSLNQEKQTEKINTAGAQKNTATSMQKTSSVVFEQSNLFQNQAYSDELKTTQDVMQDAKSQPDVKQNRDRLTVLSASMSSEDLAKAMQEGFDLREYDVEDAVTIVDKIKTTMAQSGTVIQGYNSDLKASDIEKVTGSTGYAQAIEKALKQANAPVNQQNVKDVQEAVNQCEEVKELTGGSVKYLLENHLEPTIENIYRAAYSGAGDGTRQAKGYFSQEMPGYYAKKADAEQGDQLSTQISSALETMDFSKEELPQAEAAAKWMVDKGILLSGDSVRQLLQIQSIPVPFQTDQIAGAAADAISEGKSATQGVLVPSHQTVYEKAVSILNQTQAVTDEAVSYAAKNNDELTLKDLFLAQQTIEQSAMTADIGNTANTVNMMNAVNLSNTGNTPNTGNTANTINIDNAAGDQESLAFITAKRQLEQVRLQMTTEANVKLLKSDYSIDTTQLSQLVEDLKEQEFTIKQHFLGAETTDDAAIRTQNYEETISCIREIPTLPAAVLAKINTQTDTLPTLYDAGVKSKAQYEAAQASYEMIQTTPRKDLGDSIKKAFRNTDELLEEQSIPVTEENERAVRILGYNQMEITPESIETVKEADRQVNNVIEKMTPDRVLKMIRENQNPLELSLDELNTALDKETTSQTEEKYSTFLYQLEQNKQISTDERKAYVGIYRLINQIEKSDGAAVGAVVSQNGELSFDSLLSAVRSGKADINVTVDDSFGMVKELIQKGDSISEQIQEGIRQSRISQDISEAAAGDDSVIEALLENDQPVTIHNMLAMQAISENRGGLYRIVKKAAQKFDSEAASSSENINEDSLENQFDKISEELLQKMGDQDDFSQTYQDFQNSADTILSTASESADTYLDVKSLSLCHKQLALSASLGEKENYEIPVMLNGTMSSINLTIEHAEGKAEVAVTMEEETMGTLRAKIQLTDNRVDAVMVCENANGTSLLEEIGRRFTSQLQTKEMEIGQIQYLSAAKIDLNSFLPQQNDKQIDSVSKKQLYQLAKEWILSVQDIETERE